MEKALRFLRGYLHVRIWGFSPERFMNLCAGKGIFLWDIRRSAEYYDLYMDLQSFYKLRPIARKTGVKVVILERIGLPFFMPKIRRRWVFLLGIFLAVAFWVGSSFFIWKIGFYGNLQVTDDQLMTFLADRDIRIGTFCKKLDITELEKEIRREFPVVTWTSLKLVGTGLEVWIKENEMMSPGAGPEVTPGRDLVSEYSARVVSMIVREGVPRVGKGDTVTKGQILVEGKVPVYNEDGTVREYLYVNADADILLEHSILFEASLSEFYETKEYSGRFEKEYFIRIGEKYIRLPYRHSFFRDTKLQKNHVPFLTETLNIPVCLGEIQHWEYLTVKKKYTEEEAQKLLNEKISIFLATLEEKGLEILEKNVRIDKEGEYWLVYGKMTVREWAEDYRDTE